MNKPKSPAQIASWAMEIAQLKTAHCTREGEICRLRLQLHQMLDRNSRLQAEIVRQEIAFAAAVQPPAATHQP